MLTDLSVFVWKRMSTVPVLYPDSNGSITIANRKDVESPDVILFNSWFCPYGQRTWITLEELGINYKYVEVDPYHKPKSSSSEKYTKIALSLSEKQNKYPLFIEASPFGLIPGLIDVKYGNSKVCESLICMEYLNNRYSKTKHDLLLKNNHYINAYIKIWTTHCNDRIITFYYKMLLSQDKKEQNEYKDKLLNNLLIWIDEMIKNDEMNDDDYYFLGAKFSFIDIALFPWIQRIVSVSKYYRDFEIPNESINKQWKRFWLWYNAVKNRKSVKNTVVDYNKLIENYSGYAQNTADNDASAKFRDVNQNINNTNNQIWIGIGIGVVIGVVLKSVFTK